MTVTKGVRRILAIKMLLNFSEGILMASLTLFVPECMVAPLAALSAFHFCRGLGVARFYKKAPARPDIEYENSGQKYMYVVRAGEREVECFSDIKYCSTDDVEKIIQTLVDDGKISIEDGSEVEVEARSMW